MPVTSEALAVYSDYLLAVRGLRVGGDAVMHIAL